MTVFQPRNAKSLNYFFLAEHLINLYRTRCPTDKNQNLCIQIMYQILDNSLFKGTLRLNNFSNAFSCGIMKEIIEKIWER